MFYGVNMNDVADEKYQNVILTRVFTKWLKNKALNKKESYESIIKRMIKQ